MAKPVKLYGAQLDRVPLAGKFLASEAFLKTMPNTLSIGRALCGSAIAGYLLTHSPEERSWRAGISVMVAGATDKLDGDLARALKDSLPPSNQRNREAIGARLDHLADKLFVGPPMVALAMNEEISWAHPVAKFTRDVRTGKIKNTLRSLSGDYPSAHELAQIKTVAEIAALAVSCSPLAAESIGGGDTTLPEMAFTVATTLSLASGDMYVNNLLTALHDRDSAAAAEIVAGSLDNTPK